MQHLPRLDIPRHYRLQKAFTLSPSGRRDGDWKFWGADDTFLISASVTRGKIVECTIAFPTKPRRIVRLEPFNEKRFREIIFHPGFVVCVPNISTDVAVSKYLHSGQPVYNGLLSAGSRRHSGEVMEDLLQSVSAPDFGFFYRFVPVVDQSNVMKSICSVCV